METFECICSRRTCTEFEDRPIDRQELGKILEAGRHAPSPGNVQSWEFVVLEDPEKKEKLSKIAADERVKIAPANIIICSNQEKIEREFGEKGTKLYSIQESSTCIQNMLLEAHNQELGSFWTSSFNEEKLSGLLRLPKPVRPLAIIAIGHPKQLHKPERKYKISELTYLDEYGNRIHSVYDKFEWEGIMKYAKKLRSKL